MTTRRCCLLSCQANEAVGSTIGLHYHGLPKNEELRSKWLDWIVEENGRNWEAAKNLYVCSKHFKEEDKVEIDVQQGILRCEIASAENESKQHSKKCAALGCSGGINKSYFSFPSIIKSNLINKTNLERCKTWIKNCGNLSLLSIETHKLHSKYFLCGDHFTDDQFYNYHRKTLLPKAIPTNFKCDPLNELQLQRYPILNAEDAVIGLINRSQSQSTSSSVGHVFISSQESACSLSNVILRGGEGEDQSTSSQEPACLRSKVILQGAEGQDGEKEVLCNDKDKLNQPKYINCKEDAVFQESNIVDACMFFSESGFVLTQSYEDSRHPSQSCPATSKRKNNRPSRKCAAEGCFGSASNSYFTFPSITISDETNMANLERCKTWIKNSGNLSLLSTDTNKLHSKYFLCNEHFSDDQFYNHLRRTLLPKAIPTIFKCDPLNELEMKHYPVLGIEEVAMGNGSSSVAVEEGNADRGTEGNNISDNSNNFDSLQFDFEKKMNSLKWITCPNCKEKFFKHSSSNVKCLHSKNNCSMYTKENNMDPLDVPPQLQDLNYVEEQLIARIHPLISIFKLKGHQYGYRGNIINFPQNVESLAKKLPHNIEDLSSLITVRTTDEINPVDFHVRAGKVRAALECLKKINPYYCDIEISEENLNKLPDDGNVFDKVTHLISADSDEESDIHFESSEDNEDIEINLVTETCVPSISKPSTTERAETVLNWPEIGKEAINEFKTPGYIAMAFPCLFPYGKADLRSPREREIRPLQYFKHLLQYQDERFAKHPRFRYFALNSIMRWNALKNGGVFVKKNSGFKDMNVAQLKQELEKNPNLIKKILFYNSNLRGTRSYWYARGQELLAMIEQLGLPTIFFTLSAADLHWPDLFHFLAPDEDINSMSETRRRKLIQENPSKVDAFFMERSDTFITEVLKKKFNVRDMWYRVEYQHRGSPHIHGVLWLVGAPKFEDLTKASPDELIAIANYFDEYVSTTHPDRNCPRGPVHPSRIRLSEVVDVKKDLAQLLNRVQRHTEHRDGYCLRINKKTGKKECRFKFPYEYKDTTEIVITNENDVELITARNDQSLNKYNPYIIQTWRANVDVSPVLSRRALINYLAKYVTKSETKSKEMIDVLKLLMSKSNDDKSAKTIVQQLYIQSCCERDISAQETCHLLMGLPLYSSGGRKFVTLNFKVLDSESWVHVEENDNKSSKSFIEKYMDRPERYENESLWFMAKNYVLPSGRKHSKGKEAIVQIYPRLSKTTDLEQYHRQQVLLFVPWKYEGQFIEQYGSWEQAYQINENVIKNSFQAECRLDGLEADDPEYEEVDPADSLTTEEWMSVSRMGPTQNAEKTELGRRDLDVNHNWHQASKKYEQYGDIQAIKSFVHEQRKITCTAADTPKMPSVEFTSEQETVLNLLKLQIASLKNENSVSINFGLPQSVIVQGKAGTGKSLLIHAMKSLIYEAFGENACVLLGPTGVSALNINGSTIHSKLYIYPKGKELLPLTGNALHEFRKKFEKTSFIIIDEYSMVGCNMLGIIEKRLREALDREDEQYGGIFIYFFGDIQQLAPVGDSPAYKNNQVSIDYINGKLLYKNIDGAVILSKVKRQTDENFLNVLHNISSGNVSKTDYDFLQKRFTTSVSSQEIYSFKDGIRLFPTRKEVDDYNKNIIENLKDSLSCSPVPVARVPAKHNSVAAMQGTDNEAGGLKPVLYLAKGAKIMLRANLWTEKGLVNGAIGHIIDILYREDTNPPEDPPAALVCRFDTFKGPYLNEDEKSVVIEAITKQWKNKQGEDCTREQFPVSLCYSCSIHKSQGLTLEKAHVNIGCLKEMSPGLTYTALSRVRSLSGLLLEPFDLKRLVSLNHKKCIKDRVEWIEELSQKLISDLTL